MLFSYILRYCRLNFIILDGKLAAGHQKQDINPNSICLVMNVTKHHINKTFSREEDMAAHCFFFQTKNLLKAFRNQLKMFKSTLGIGLAFTKKIPALVNLCVTNINGTNH
jgi:hypothetical protein